jgi:GntR family transcriptional regulator, trigonelline degradation regulator
MTVIRTDSTKSKQSEHAPPMQFPASLRVTKTVKLLREQVSDKLRHAIVHGWYKPGTRLIERELCENVGASRTSVREALRQLETEGLVVVEPRRGPVVASISLTQAKEIYELRRVFEVFAIRKFIKRGSAENLVQLRQCYRSFAEAVRKNELPALVDSMSTFYSTLFQGAGNGMLETISAQLLARISYLRATSMSTKGRPRVSLREIAAILQAIENSDITAAERAVTDHIEEASKAAFAQLNEQAAPS